MSSRMRRTVRAGAALLGAGLLALATGGRLYATDTTKVNGTVTDVTGKPLEKVEVWFENAKIQGKRVGPVKTNKKGKYIYPYLDVGIEPEWRVVPKLPGYLVLKVNWKLIDSQRNDRGSNEAILNTKQEIPSLHPVLVGDSGVNEVNFVMVKEEEFNNALRQAVAAKQGGSANGGVAPPGGNSAPATPGTSAAPAPPPEPTAPTHSVTEAVDLIKAGKNEEAIPILKEFLEKNPNNAPVQFTLGKALVNTKQFDQAVPALQKALAIKPDQQGAHFFLGIAYSQMGQDADALKEFEAEIPLSPAQDAAYSNAAAICEKQGNQDKALEYYKKAVEIAPNRAELHASLAGIYEKKGNQPVVVEAKGGTSDLGTKIISVSPSGVIERAEQMSPKYFGAIAKNNDRNEEAVKAFQKAVELDPGYALAHRELGYALVKQGDFKGAVTHFNKYLELVPKAPDAGEIRSMAKQLSQ